MNVENRCVFPSDRDSVRFYSDLVSVLCLIDLAMFNRDLLTLSFVPLSNRALVTN